MVYLSVMMFLSLALTLIIGFGYIGFVDIDSKPDEVICQANSTNKLPFPKNVTENPELVERWNIVNVSKRFQILFISGFYIMLTSTILWIIYYCPCIQNNRIPNYVGKVILGIATLVYLGFFITANVFRFEHTGKVCSGEYGWFPKHKKHNDTKTQDLRDQLQHESLYLRGIEIPGYDQIADTWYYKPECFKLAGDDGYDYSDDKPFHAKHLIEIEGDFIKTYIVV